ncbi:hypothetical protein IAD21_01454 [Abditibacteriota bacterium]|nr:hypothetical protein IAD21_01454 [Abditibacteriota bacterium]
MPQFRAIIERAIEGGVFPGASVHLARGREVIWSGAVGKNGYEAPFHESVSVGTLYDIASLSKIYTLAAALCALSEASLAPETTPLRAFLPGFDSRISLEHLFNHSSGLARHLQTLETLPASQWVEELARETLQTEPGRVVLYNCSNYFLLARALEKLTGQTLDELIARYLLRPLRLENTTFAPCDLGFVAPTEAKRGEKGFWHGVPHDEAARAWRLQTGTSAGNAGLFATASDVARFASIWLLDGQTSPLPSVWRARAMMHPLPEGNARRGWGWQRDAAFFMGTLPANESGRRSFLIGHLGFTGASLVLNPRGGEVAVVLSNRVHPSRMGPDRLPYVRALHDEFWRSAAAHDLP